MIVKSEGSWHVPIVHKNIGNQFVQSALEGCPGKKTRVGGSWVRNLWLTNVLFCVTSLPKRTYKIISLRYLFLIMRQSCSLNAKSNFLGMSIPPIFSNELGHWPPPIQNYLITIIKGFIEENCFWEIDPWESCRSWGLHNTKVAYLILGWIPTIPPKKFQKENYPCCWDLSMALVRGKWTAA